MSDWIRALAVSFAKRLVQEVQTMENTQALMARYLIGRTHASPLVIRYHEDDLIIHTNDLPWCDDPGCPCHYDFTVAGEAEYQAIIEQPLADGLLTEPEAARIYDGKQV